MTNKYLIFALFCFIVSELSFTFYISVFGLSNVVGHFFKLFGVIFIYRAVVVVCIKDPYNTVFEKLKHNQEVLQKKNEEFVEFEKVRRSFFSSVSHELRTPITSLILSSTLLKKYGLHLTDKKKIRLVQNITNTSKTLSRLVEDLLVLSRIDSEKLKLHKKEIDLNRLIQEVINILKPKARINNINIDFVPKGQKNIRIDKHRFSQVLRIILENAIKYSKEGSFVEISWYNTKRPKGLEIAIGDRGIGIKEEDQKKVFQRFFRAEEVASIDGSGLGLSIAKVLVELHDGELTFESQVGEGSVFKVFLPS